MRNWFQEMDGFRRAVQGNIIPEPIWRSEVNLAFLNWATSQTEPKPIVPNQKTFEYPAQNPRTQRYFENTRGPVDLPDNSEIYYIEVCKKSVQWGHTGVVKGFNQKVEYEQEILSSPDYWGNPFTLAWVLRWHFRIEPYDGSDPAWLTAPLIGSHLPGEPHQDMPFTDAIQYPWHSPASQLFHLLIPGGRRLRVIVEVPALVDPSLTVAAGIRGFTIGDYGLQTHTALRSIW